MADLDYDRVDNRPTETVVVRDQPRRSVWRWLLPLLILLAVVIGAIYLFNGSDGSSTVDTPNSVTVPKPNVPDVDVNVSR
ncbi:hypothetical protein H7Y63_03640 [Polaromonas sp.]|nr:hypothetical protein [Candidatus Saccharibacteria bacterium]